MICAAAHPEGGHLGASGRDRLTAAHHVRFVALKEDQKSNLTVFRPIIKARNTPIPRRERVFRHRPGEKASAREAVDVGSELLVS